MRLFCMEAATGMSVVTLPSHTPDSAFNLSKDFCASDWAKAPVDSNSNIRGRRMNFMVLSPQGYWSGRNFSSRTHVSGQFYTHIVLYSTITLHHMQAFFCSRHIFRRRAPPSPLRLRRTHHVLPTPNCCGLERQENLCYKITQRGSDRKIYQRLQHSGAL